jgi:hypothetical protein
MLSAAAFGQNCSQDEFASFPRVKAAVSRILSSPAYTGSDEKILNRSGDLAAMAIIRTLAVQELTSPEKGRQILVILHMAFEAPSLIEGCDNRTPTAALLLLDQLQRTELGQSPNAIDNVRGEIQHNASTGRPYEVVALEGTPVLDEEHTQWVSNVLGWTGNIKPGMTRKDLLRVFTEEGGLSWRTQRTYVLKGCPYVHIKVKFSPVADERDHLTAMPGDKIVEISKPFLDYAYMD